MKEKFDFKNKHHAEAALIVCVDFRFHETYLKLAKNHFKMKTFDLWTIPGVAKIFVNDEDKILKEAILGKIDKVSIKLHQVKEIILINHADCGAYGGRRSFKDLTTEREAHFNDLKKARKQLKKNFPNIEVKIGYLDLIGDEVTLLEV